jgi:hypothetical protein
MSRNHRHDRRHRYIGLLVYQFQWESQLSHDGLVPVRLGVVRRSPRLPPNPPDSGVGVRNPPCVRADGERQGGEGSGGQGSVPARLWEMHF